MPLIATHELENGTGNIYAYNGLDSLLTHGIWSNLKDQLPAESNIYNFEIGLQGPVLEMMVRGFRVDPIAREKGIIELRARLTRLSYIIDELASAVWDFQPPISKNTKHPKPTKLNPESTDQLIKFFYDTMGIPPIIKYTKGEEKVPMDRDTLEKLEHYFLARPIVNAILAYRDAVGQLEVLESEVDSDWRMRTVYQIGATDTTRFSSTKSVTGSGRNMQNIEEALRHIFIADEGFKLYGIDLEQAESREVGLMCGLLFDDWKYLDLCECLTEDHEVLTQEGWQPISSQPEKIMTWLHGRLKFDDVIKWHKGKTTELISVENRMLSVLGTTGHGMPVYTGTNGMHLSKKTLKEIQAHPNYVAPTTGEYRQGIVHEKNAALIAAFQADGTRDKYGKIHWSFTKERKINEMRKLLIAGDFKYSEYNLGSGATRFYLHMGQGQEKWSKTCGQEILSWDYASLTAFCESHKHWDGCISNNNVFITAKERTHLDWLATAYAMVGYNTNITSTKDIYWNLTVKSIKNTQYRSAKITTVKTEGTDVYCPTVADGYFLVRRNGKIYISGNSSDLHTAVCKMVWPNLDWNANPEHNRAIADVLYYRDQSYRQMTKRLSHASNYLGLPKTISMHTKIPIQLVKDFQNRYFSALPAIPRWHQWVASEIQTKQALTDVFGVTRSFFGRVTDDDVLRAAVAHGPQGATAKRTNLGMWRLWRHYKEIQLLAQVHDAVYFQAPAHIPEAEVAKRAIALMEVHQIFRGRHFVIPCDIKCGQNWRPYDKVKNPQGLRKINFSLAA